jgi:hypothetical protein
MQNPLLIAEEPVRKQFLELLNPVLKFTFPNEKSEEQRIIMGTMLYIIRKAGNKIHRDEFVGAVVEYGFDGNAVHYVRRVLEEVRFLVYRKPNYYLNPSVYLEVNKSLQDFLVGFKQT